MNMKKFKLSFARLSMYTGYTVGLVAALMFFWTKDLTDLSMVMVARLFVDAAQVSAKIENNLKEK